jgi:hypothetical protein
MSSAETEVSDVLERIETSMPCETVPKRIDTIDDLIIRPMETSMLQQIFERNILPRSRSLTLSQSPIFENFTIDICSILEIWAQMGRYI